jgi:hypothetical protein
VALSGASGAAGALLLAIGSGATAAAALVAYSGLGAASAAAHLMHERAGPERPPAIGWLVRARARRTRQAREDELIWMRDAH